MTKPTGELGKIKEYEFERIDLAFIRLSRD
jgi:hypothetical protein